MSRHHVTTPVPTLALLLALCLSSATWPAAPTAAANDTDTDREALLCLKSHLISDPTGGALSTWRSGASPDFCGWRGVSCTSAGRVAALDLEAHGLAGDIPQCVSNLTSLARLHLPYNRLSGRIPPELARLAGLSYLNLSSNALSGAIPGDLPLRCTNLRVVDLMNNSIQGGIPAALFNSSSIRVINLRFNNLSGNIPPFSSSSSRLQYASLTSNSLSGEIPPSIGNISSLATLLLAENQLTGSIPDSLGRLSGMQQLDLTYNRLSGTVPSSIYNLSLLTYLGLGDNDLVGKLPASMGNTLPNIRQLMLSSSRFEGEIPASLANASELEYIYLANNSLTGVIPSFGSLSNLRSLNLFSNRLEAADWAFLSSLTNCTELERINLSGNMLQGDLPTSVANLSKNLEHLVLGSNNITGTIPSDIGNLVGLSMLYLENNSLTGPLPPSLGHLQKMFVLSLSYNKFSGQVPTSIGNMNQLSKLHLQKNNLTGSIPADLARCKNLLALNISYNAFNGSIPTELFSNLNQLNWWLDLSNNQLTHTIPTQVGALINLGILNISNNKLSGQIPSTLGSCALLQSLRLEGNLLEGSIPQSLMNLKGIREIDLSRNNLSGEIPEFFESLSTLQYFNVSFNNLEGSVPSSGVFANASEVFVQGNPRLCANSQMLQLPRCFALLSRRKHKPLVPVVLASAFCAAAVGLLILLFLKKRRSKVAHPLYDAYEKLKLSYGELSKATNDFSSANLIGSGRFGKVYRGRLVNVEVDLVAIKVFMIDQLGASDSFIAECKALRNSRHRNLVKVLTACSTYDPTGNEFKALVLEYMANGSLESRLHAKSNQYGALSLGERINIAVDIASAIDYLHNWCVPPMVHCDLKPGNVLLDDDDVAHVCDFGLARFLHGCYSSENPNSSTSSLIGLRGSIGYIAPEYGMCSEISPEGDVYSYGIILLEMLTGKRPTDEVFKDGLTLRKLVEASFPHKTGEILDTSLTPHMGGEHFSQIPEREHFHVSQMLSCIVQLLNLGLSCSEESPKDRPSTQEVYSIAVEIKEHFFSFSN